MAITVGLDFGTHQTKICIEDTADKQNPKYTFWKFKDLDKRKQFVLPSIVQLNEDNTLSYGFVSDSNCKLGFHIDIAKPQMPEIPEPKLSLPPKPELSIPEIHCKLDTAETQKYENLKKRIKATNKMIEADYYAICSLLRKQYDIQQKAYTSAWDIYHKKLQRWEMHQSTPAKIRYFYFKQALFSTLEWKYKDTNPQLLSIWFIANILFDLEKEFGQEFAIQMGIPTGAKDFDRKKQLATSILLSAYKLVEETYKNNKEAFLSATIDELEAVTEIVPYSKEKKYEYNILVFPEAYAGLRMMTARKKITNGMNLNIDIGGGTTDISFFTIDNGRPHIYRYESIPKGINWIVQEAFGDNAILKTRAYLNFNVDIKSNEHKQQSQAVREFHKHITNTHDNIIIMLWNEWMKRMGASHKSHLLAALKNRPAIYMGGGSVYKQLRNAIKDFSEVLIVDKEFWSGIQIENVGNLYPVLNTALGLSVGEKDDNIQIHSICELFEGYGELDSKEADKEDYNLLDVD